VRYLVQTKFGEPYMVRQYIWYAARSVLSLCSTTGMIQLVLRVFRFQALYRKLLKSSQAVEYEGPLQSIMRHATIVGLARKAFCCKPLSESVLRQSKRKSNQLCDQKLQGAGDLREACKSRFPSATPRCMKIAAFTE
jgi:hypothetical protein